MTSEETNDESIEDQNSVDSTEDVDELKKLEKLIQSIFDEKFSDKLAELNSLIQNIFQDANSKFDERIEKSFSENGHILGKYISEYQSIETKTSEISNQLDSLSTSLSEEKEKTSAFIDSTKTEFSTYLDNIKELSANSETLSENIRNLSNEISNTYNTIFGYSRLDRKYLTEAEEEYVTIEDNKEYYNGSELKSAKFKDGSVKKYYHIDKKIPGALDQLKIRETEVASFLSEAAKKNEELTSIQNDKFNKILDRNSKTYEDLLGKIKDLYEDAIGVGLAGAYNKAKSSHQISLYIWSVTLVLSVLGMLAVPVSMEIWVFTEKLVKIETVTGILKRVLSYLPFISPMVFLSYIASKNMNGYRRMFEEYLHKESTSLTYEALKREISNFEDEDISSELAKQLLRQNLKSAEDNPSKYLDKIDGDLPTDILKSIVHGRKINISVGGPFGTKVNIDSIDRKETNSVEKESLASGLEADDKEEEES